MTEENSQWYQIARFYSQLQDFVENTSLSSEEVFVALLAMAVDMTAPPDQVEPEVEELVEYLKHKYDAKIEQPKRL